MNLPILKLRAGREKSVLLRHPWIFASAIQDVLGEPQSGQTLLVQDSFGEALGLAAYSPDSQIRARMWTWNAQNEINRDFFAGQLKKALQLRKPILDAGQTSAFRLVHGESDGLPGLIVDQYNDTLVMQVLTAGAEFHRSELVDLLTEISGCQRIYERSDVDVRELEGLTPLA